MNAWVDEEGVSWRALLGEDGQGGFLWTLFKGDEQVGAFASFFAAKAYSTVKNPYRRPIEGQHYVPPFDKKR